MYTYGCSQTYTLYTVRCKLYTIHSPTPSLLPARLFFRAPEELSTARRICGPVGSHDMWAMGVTLYNMVTAADHEGQAQWPWQRLLGEPSARGDGLLGLIVEESKKYNGMYVDDACPLVQRA